MLRYQDKLLEKINTYTMSTFPQSILLLGEAGSGRHTVIKLVGDKFGLDIIDISQNISHGFIDDLYATPSPYIFIIDVDKLIGNKRIDLIQNIILKFIEEPPVMSKIFIIGKNKQQFFSTVLNRCHVWEMALYDRQSLMEFARDNNISVSDELFKVVTTPGQLLKVTGEDIPSLLHLCDTIVDKINIASIPNVLTIVDKIKIKDTDKGFDFDLFCNILLYKYAYKCKICTDDFLTYKACYNAVQTLINKSCAVGINKKDLLQSCLLSLRGI